MTIKASFIAPTTFIVRHQNSNEAFWIEYATAEGAQEAAAFIASTQGGSTTVFAAAELRSYWRGNDLQIVTRDERDPEETVELPQVVTDDIPRDTVLFLNKDGSEAGRIVGIKE